jgi:ABC-type Fe3+/spermidine/putrescine transport system ATPase subunit
VRRTYPGYPPVLALAGIDLTIRRGELVAIVGPSGSGTSTLLHVMGILDRPDSGSVRIVGLDTARLTDRQLAALRATRIGFVFQQFFLAEHAAVADNVALSQTGRVGWGYRRHSYRARHDLDAMPDHRWPEGQMSSFSRVIRDQPGYQTPPKSAVRVRAEVAVRHRRVVIGMAQHLRSADFFDVAKHPRVVVSVRRVTLSDAAMLNAEGTLEAAGIAEPVSFTASVVAASPDQVTLRAQLSIDRSRLGMTWSPLRISSLRATGSITATFTRSTAG